MSRTDFLIFMAPVGTFISEDSNDNNLFQKENIRNIGCKIWQNNSAVYPHPTISGLQASKYDLKLENSSTPQCLHIQPQLGAFRVVWPQNVPQPEPSFTGHLLEESLVQLEISR